MTLANMREHGVGSVEATCEACQHEATVNVESLPDHVYVPDVALKLRCSACGSKRIKLSASAVTIARFRRVEQEHLTEGVMARDPVPQLQKLPQERLLGPAEQGHVRAVFPAA